MPYATTPLAQAQVDLSNRLMDASFTRWVAPELTIYLQEALRTWNALTAAFRATDVFSSTLTQPFYDLGVVLPRLRPLTVTDRQLIIAIEYALLETPSVVTPIFPFAWLGTAQFSLADVTQAIQRRRDQFLFETSAILTEQRLPISPPPDGRVAVPEPIIAIKRAAWVSAPEALITPLLRDDEWALSHYATNWVQSPTRPPQVFSVGVTPPLFIQLAPPPLDTGALDLVTINTGPVLNPSAADTVLGIPDDYAWVVKFGALADLLSRDGLAYDPKRAAYCEARWQQGITLAQLASVVLGARINNVSCLISSLASADTYSPLWQTVPGTVDSILTAGQNLIALSPPPGALPGGAQFAITLDVVRNAPIPVQQSDFLQVGQETLDVIYDYAIHLALFKEGPDQLQDSYALFQRFIRAAIAAQDFNQSAVPARVALLEQTLRAQRRTTPVLPKPPVPDSQAVLTGGA